MRKERGLQLCHLKRMTELNTLRRGTAEPQDCSGNFLKLIFFNMEINKI